MRAWLASAVVDSSAQAAALYLLRNVPGLPPIAQSLHILSVAVVMGSVGMLNLRFLRLAVPSQNPSEMLERLMPWTWCALSVQLATGMLFLLAQPYRYAQNPVAAWKFSLLVPAVGIAGVMHAIGRREPEYWERSSARWRTAQGLAGLSLALWTLVLLAGRWIAYADYLFP